MDGWRDRVDAVVRGDAKHLREIRLGPTPEILRRLGLGPRDLYMSSGKLAKARRDHPEVSLATWHALPGLIADPDAAFPSIRKDGSIVVALAVKDADGNPVIVPITSDSAGTHNVVLSVYGKADKDRQTGDQWISAQIEAARREGMPVYEKKGSAGAQPQPGSAEAIPSSSGPIPVDGPAKPRRQILTLRQKVKSQE